MVLSKDIIFLLVIKIDVRFPNSCGIDIDFLNASIFTHVPAQQGIDPFLSERKRVLLLACKSILMLTKLNY